MSLPRFITIAAALASLSGCATGYQSIGFTGGYVEAKAPGNLERVQFAGNGLVSADLIEQYGVYRAAEFSLSKGKPHFLLYQSLSAAALERPSLKPTIAVLAGKPVATAYLLLLDAPQAGSRDARATMQQLKQVIDTGKIASN